MAITYSRDWQPSSNGHITGCSGLFLVSSVERVDSRPKTKHRPLRVADSRTWPPHVLSGLQTERIWPDHDLQYHPLRYLDGGDTASAYDEATLLGSSDFPGIAIKSDLETTKEVAVAGSLTVVLYSPHRPWRLRSSDQVGTPAVAIRSLPIQEDRVDLEASAGIHLPRSWTAVLSST